MVFLPLPGLGLIFLRYADARFAQAQQEIEAELAGMSARRRARADVAEMYQARGVMFVPEEARFARLVSLPEGADIGQAVVEAMKAIEAHNPQLKDVLPKTYRRFRDETLTTLLKNFNSIPMDIEGDAFGRIYEYFLGKFAMSEGQRGGQFFTPTSIVRLIVEIIEPYTGRILDPACGSGGMFVQSARFVDEHRNGQGQVPGTSDDSALAGVDSQAPDTWVGGDEVPGTSDDSALERVDAQVPGTWVERL